ncbi:hypothetical protein [Burkholderia cepacia]|uniref:hypothetical protein n=1 Tax=Burkholderia cepacia TaxID=292 RepID=UPI0012D8F7E3|nr:hypothetical protein [Burkholderia cepacia]
MDSGDGLTRGGFRTVHDHPQRWRASILVSRPGRRKSAVATAWLMDEMLTISANEAGSPDSRCSVNEGVRGRGLLVE